MNDFRNDHWYEEALISTILQDPVWTLKNASQLSPVLFDNERCRIIFDAVIECGNHWDFISVTAALRLKGNLEKVGGVAGVSEFCNVGIMSHQANDHLQVVRRYSVLRRALQAHKEAQTKLEAALTQGTADAAGLLSIIREELDTAAKLPGKRLNRLSAAEAMKLVVDRIEERAANPGKIAGLSTGFELLDKYTHGLQAGHVWVFAGGPGDGKSTMMQNVLEAAAQNARTAVYQLEMSIEEQAMRFLASDAQVDSGSILKGYMTEAEKMALAAGCKRLKKTGTDFVDTDGATAADIISDIESGDYRVVMVDYLQLMEIEASKGENREQAVSRIAKDLKNVAKRKKCTILTGSQLNDDGKLRESRAIGQHADKVALVRRWEAEGEPDMTRRLLVLEKNRGGPPLEKIPFRFNGASFRFSEFTEDEEPDWTSGMKPTTKRRR